MRPDGGDFGFIIAVGVGLCAEATEQIWWRNIQNASKCDQLVGAGFRPICLPSRIGGDTDTEPFYYLGDGQPGRFSGKRNPATKRGILICLLYTSDAADE